MIRVALVVSFILFLAFSCDEDSQPRTFEVVTIGKGYLSGNGVENISKQNIVVTNQIDWSELIEAMNTLNDVSSSFTEINIDFSRFQIVAAFEEIKYSGGHSIDITEVIETEHSIEVKVENLNKGNLTSIVTQPYHIVKIPKSDKQVVFV
jgi:hypothetical protein